MPRDILLLIVSSLSAVGRRWRRCQFSNNIFNIELNGRKSRPDFDLSNPNVKFNFVSIQKPLFVRNRIFSKKSTSIKVFAWAKNMSWIVLESTKEHFLRCLASTFSDFFERGCQLSIITYTNELFFLFKD